jgi:hypothetical protein
MKKTIVIVAAVLGLAASLEAQSLGQMARQEKARRAGLGRHAAVVKNEDLRLVKKAPAVEVSRPEGWVAEAPALPGQTAGPVGGAAEAPAAPPDGANRADVISEAGGPLDQLKAADALVEELTTEMNSLRQQFASQNAMVPGYVIQQQIDETYQRLVQAQEQQAQMRQKLGSRAPAPKKDPGDPAR